MAAVDLEYNKGFQIYNSDGTLFHDLVLHKCTYETVVMSLGDKISGILYYKDNALDVKMTEYIIYKGVKYTLVNPPTILKEGLVSDNGELKGMTKYSFTFYHPMYVLNNFSFNDVAVSSDQNKYLSQNKTFSWIGNLNDYVAKINKNLQGTEWFVKVGDNVTQEEKTKLSDVLSFDKNTIAEALKRGYETWEVPYVVDSIQKGEYFYINDKNQKIDYYDEDKRFVVQYGLPTTEITVKDDNDFETPFVFKMGQGVGLKNNSRNPKNNKIITRIAGYGSEDNIPYGYPQIRYYGGTVQYPLYYGIVGGQRVQLIKHPFTRNHLMPSVYGQAVYNKVNPKLSDGSNNPNYNPDIELVDYYDADSTYANPIKSSSPSYEIHEFGDIKPELGEETIINAVPVNAQETQEDYKQKSDFLQEILNRISSTDIDDEKVCLKTLYDKVDAGLSYYAQKGEEGGSEYWYRISVTSDEYYQYVSYESGNYNFTATVLKNDSSAPTPEWDDTMDDDGKYLQSYFKITLPILSFDLYACAAITQEMKINMRSGACIGCTFPVQVDWDDYKRNFYNSDGEFDPDGEQRDYTKYPDSSSGQITVMVKKELETFGTLMPNQYQQPTTGDKFVILGISLPESYITNAEQRLDTDMKQYMRDNNVYYYEYPLKFDEHFLISNENILSQMKPNVVVRFEYAGETHALYIKQMSVKYNESPLPKYDITLTDDIEIVLNQIGQVTDEVSKLRLGLGENGIGGNGQEYLRKDIDDTARGTIRMIKGMQVGERFVTGLLGEGGVFRKDVDGTTYLETDKLYVRMKAYFDTVEVKHYLHTGGNRIASQASGIVCSRVEYIDNNGDVTTDLGEAVLFRCYFKANDGDKTIRNDFMIGDLAFCRETNVDVSEINMHSYWRLVIGRNGKGSLTENKEAWIDLSNRASETLTIDGIDYVCNGYQNGSDAPIAQDDIIQLGNIANKDRQGAIVEYVGGEDAPSYQIFQGIGEDLPYPYTLENKNYIGIGYSSQTGRAYMNVYGDAYIGDPDGSTFIKYEQEDSQTHQPKMTIKAVVEFQSPDDPTQTTTLEQFASAIVGDIENIQSQIDGEIDTWFYAGVPTLQNAPANEWPTDAEKEKHAGDLYYDIGTGTDAGKAYRFVRSQNKPYVYSWQYIDDTAITEALRIAAHAQDTADHKRRVFVTQPLPPYDIGDLWSDAVYPSGNTEKDSENGKYYKDLLTCKVAKKEGERFSISDWGLTTNYTDDSAFNKFFADTYQPFVTQIQEQVDGKAETWYQSTDPSAAWNTPELKQTHVGDIWHNTSSATVSGVEAGQDAIWSGSEWKPSTVPQEVYDKIDGKASIYTDTLQDPPTNYKENDLWIIPADYTINGVSYKKGEVLTATSDSVGFNQAHWTKKVRYTDDSSLNDFKANKYVTQLTNGIISTNITNAQNAANAAQQAADDAQADADAAAAAAANAQTSATNANNRLDGWANDGSISPTEKTSIKLEWENVKKEYTQICNDADKYGVPKTAFAHAYTSANAAFQKYTAATPENITISADYNNIAAYYAARQTILDAITQAAKKVATDAATAAANAQAKADSAYTLAGNAQSAAQAAEAHAATLDYVKTALKQDTIIDGGLVISTLLALRDGNNKIWSGINGAYNSAETGAGYKGHGIASWYGGAMVDKEVTTTATDYAKSLFRFDGSGYVAGGNVTWDKNGAVTIKNITTLSDSQNTNLLNELATFNNAFSFATSGTGGTTVLSITPNVQFTDLKIGGSTDEYKATTRKWVGDNYLSIAFFKRLFQAHNGSANVNPNDTSTTITDIEAMFGFWTKQYISALGKGDDGGTSTFDETAMWNALKTAGASNKIDNSHLSLYALTIKTKSGTTSYNPATGAQSIDLSNITGNYIPLTGTVADMPVTGNVTFSNTITPNGGIIPRATGGVNTRLSTDNGKLVTKQASKTVDETPTNGLVIEWGTNSNWVGQLYFGDNGTIGLYWGGWSYRSNVPTRDAWRKFAFTDEIVSNIGAGTITNAMLAGSIENGKLKNSSVTVNGTTVSLGRSITTTKWGTARTITIKDATSTNAGTAASVDGSSAVTLLLPSTIKASLTGNVTGDVSGNASTATKLQSKRKLWGNDFDGSSDLKGKINIGIQGSTSSATMLEAWTSVDSGISWAASFRNTYHVDSANGHGVGIKLTLGAETESIKWWGIAAVSTGSWENSKDLVFINNYSSEIEAVRIKNNGYVGIGTNNPSTLLHVNGYTRTNRLYLTDSIYLEYDSENKGVHLYGAGFYADTYVSALGKSDSGSSSVFDEDAMWTALGTNRTNKLIASAYLGNVTKALTIKDGNGTTLGTYNGTAAQTITVSASGNYLPLTGGTLTGQIKTSFKNSVAMGSYMADATTIPDLCEELRYSSGASGSANITTVYTKDGVTISAKWYNFVWMPHRSGGANGAASVDNTNFGSLLLSAMTGSAAECYLIRYSSQSIQNVVRLWDSSYNIAAGTITNAMLAGSIENGKLKNSKITVNGTEISLGGSMNTANITAGTAGTSSATSGGTIDIPYVTMNKYGIVTGYGTHSHSVTRLSGSDSYKAWGQTYWSNGVPKTISGNMTGVGSITMNGAISGATTISASGNVIVGGTIGVTGATTLSSTLSVSGDATLGGGLDFSNGGSMGGLVSIELNSHGDLSGYGGFIDFHFNGSSADYTSRIIEDASGRLAINSLLYVLKDGNVGIGTSSPSAKLDVQGSVKIGGATLTWDSDNQALKIDKGLYSDSFVSALGANASGGSGSGIDANWLKTNDVQIQRLGIGVAPSSSYQLNVQGASNFTGAVAIRSMLTVNSSVSAVGGFSTSQGSISSAHNITAGGDGLIHGRLTVGQDSVNTRYKLYVNGDTNITGSLTSNAFNASSVSTPKITIGTVTTQNSALLYIGGGGNSMAIWAEGSIYTHNSEVDYSDIRLKNIVEYVNNLSVDMVAKAPIFKYYWKDRINDRLRVGTSAQYWQNVLPQAVEPINDGFLGMSYATTALIASVITARKVVDHELRIKQLEQENAILREEIKSLKAA